MGDPPPSEAAPSIYTIVVVLIKRFRGRSAVGAGNTKLETIVAMFSDAPREVRLQALLDYSRRLPPLPARFAEHPERLERVPECQTAFFLAVEGGEDGTVRLFFDAPAESPTVRGYAGILHEALDGAAAEEILEIPSDFYLRMGLQEAVSSLRLRGMGAIVTRLKQRVAGLAAAPDH
jgi:cysteine desulfuration protein SufE